MVSSALLEPTIRLNAFICNDSVIAFTRLSDFMELKRQRGLKSYWWVGLCLKSYYLLTEWNELQPSHI